MKIKIRQNISLKSTKKALDHHGLNIVEMFTGIPVSTKSIMELITPVLDPNMIDRAAKVSDIQKFDVEDGGPPKKGLVLRAGIVCPRGQDDSPTAAMQRQCSTMEHPGN